MSFPESRISITTALRRVAYRIARVKAAICQTIGNHWGGCERSLAGVGDQIEHTIAIGIGSMDHTATGERRPRGCQQRGGRIERYARW